MRTILPPYYNTKGDDSSMEMRIYVANLAAYNAGELVGEWIDLPLEKDELRERIQKILDAWDDGYGPSEEWAIHDYELPFEIDEYEDPYKVNEWVERIEALPIKPDTFRNIAEYLGDVEDAIEVIERGDYAYYYCSDMAELAEEFFAGCYNIDTYPDIIRNNINWEAIGRDLELSRTFIEVDDGYIELLD